MIAERYDYMDEILQRKLHKPAEISLQIHAISTFWQQLTTQLDAAIRTWNQKCEALGALESRIIFYPNPAPVVAESRKSAKISEPAVDLEFNSVFAETFARTFLGQPKRRIYLWMTQSTQGMTQSTPGMTQATPARILYNYGVACNYNAASEIELHFENGILRQNGCELLDSTVRNLLNPLFETA